METEKLRRWRAGYEGELKKDGGLERDRYRNRGDGVLKLNRDKEMEIAEIELEICRDRDDGEIEVAM